MLPRVSSRVSGFRFAAVSMGEAAKTLLFGGSRAGCHVVLRGRHGTLWHSNLFYTVSKVSKLEEVSHEMLVLLFPRVSSRVSWFSCGLAVSMGEAAKHLLFKGFQAGCHVVCLAGVALCDTPTCFIPCRKCQNWSLEEVSHEMLVLLFPRVSSRVSGFPVASPCLWEKLKNISFSKVSKQVVMSFCWQAWQFVTFQPVLFTPHSTLYTPNSPLYKNRNENKNASKECEQKWKGNGTTTKGNVFVCVYNCFSIFAHI